MSRSRFLLRTVCLGVILTSTSAWRDAAADQPPVVVAPDSLTLRAGGQLNIDVSAHDPDGDPITSLTTEGVPDAKFVGSLSNTTGWLAWTPKAADVGTHHATFTASNSLSGSATTTIEVLPPLPPPIPPIATLTATPTAGLQPLQVTLDASGSYDPDGTIVSYEFLFGDGTSATQTSPIAVHTYSGGLYTVFVRVRDNDAAIGTAQASVRSDRRPVAQFHADRQSGPAPLVVQFGAYGSYDPDGGTIVSYGWDFGDGTTELNGDSYAIHRYDTGEWTVTLTVTNSVGNTGTFTSAISVGPEDHHPEITAPSFVVGQAGELVSIPFSASDPDGDAILALGTMAAPTNSNVSQSADHTSGVFTWTPTVADVGSRRFYLTATTNTLALWQPVVLSVWSPGLPPNRAKNPSFESDLNGWTDYAGATLERIAGGHDGSFGLRVTGPPIPNGSFGVNDSPDVIHITLSAGLCYRYTAWVRSSTSHGKAKLSIHEYLMSSGALLGEATSPAVTLTPDWQMLTVDYVTKSDWSTLDFQVRDFPVAASEVFETDEIGIYEVTGQPGTLVGVPGMSEDVADPPRITPSPVRSSGTLSFATPRRGPLRVDLLDLAGRRVRQLVDEPDVPARRWDLPIRSSGEGGVGLAPGVYFYRIDGGGVRTVGRFVLLR